MCQYLRAAYKRNDLVRHPVSFRIVPDSVPPIIDFHILLTEQKTMLPTHIRYVAFYR